MKLALTAAALLVSSLGAIAADLPARTEAPAPLPPRAAPLFAPPAAISYNWGGTYLGGAASLSMPAKDSALGKNLAYGTALFVGHNLQFGSYVVGLEADGQYSFSDERKGTGGVYTNGTAITAGNNLSSSSLWDASLRARAGYVVTNEMLAFATAGVALGGFEHGLTTVGVTAAPTAAATIKMTSTSLGWTVGAGVDYRVMTSWVARAEYRYSDFGAKSVTTTGGNLNASHKFDTSVHAVRLGAFYQFGDNSVQALIARY
jgi:outer membrane immunogenic protein